MGGHSLGGALASLATIYIRGELGIKVTKTYTFGKPRVGNYAYVKAWHALAERDGVNPPMWRVVHYRDIVPRVPEPIGWFPTAVWVFEYAHESEEVYYPSRNGSEAVMCPVTAETRANRYEDKNCSMTTSWFGCINADHVTYLGKNLAHGKRG